MNDAQDDPRDPALSRLYCQASRPEPPPALDAAILAAARAAAAPQSPPRQPLWRRLQAPLALAATAVLAVALTLSIDRNPPAELEPPSAVPAKQRAAAERTAPASPDTGSAAPPSAPAAVAPERKEAPRRAEARQETPASPRENLAPAPSAAVAGARETSAAKGLPGLAADAENRSAAGGERRKSLVAPAANPALQASREDVASVAPKPPEAWLAEIRSLRQRGKVAEAERGLREFRAAYPDYPLPEDFR
jgi:hypothetical protein